MNIYTHENNFIFVIGILLNPKHVTGALINSPREYYSLSPEFNGPITKIGSIQLAGVAK